MSNTPYTGEIIGITSYNRQTDAQFPIYQNENSDPKDKDSKKLDEFSDDMRFLCRNKIKTTKDLFSYKNLVNDELKNQISKRNTLRRKRQKEDNPEIRQTLCDEILEISNKIKNLKQEVVCIERIENQTQKIKQDIQEMEEQQKQEKNKKRGEIEK